MKKCNVCNKYYEDNYCYCLKCNRRLIEYNLTESDDEASLLQRNWKKRDDNSIKYKTNIRSKKQSALNDVHAQPQNLPKCPTCGSTNIRHISSTERGVNAVMFGFFGNKRKCQFECLNPNCRYRW